jgi:hypothetical protein
MMTPDYHHPPLVTDVLLLASRLLQNEGPDWTCAYNQTSADLPVDSLNAVVIEAVGH